MNTDGFIKKLQNIMRGDSGVDGDAQRLSQIVWILFLKVFDYKEEEWELERDYIPVIPYPFRFRDWADPKTSDGKSDIANQMTGNSLINFVNNILFPFLKGENVEYNGKKYFFDSNDIKANIVREFMTDSTNYMKNGVYLRQVVNEIASIDFDSSETRHTFNEIYEKLLKGLQEANNAGEFYTPRAITKFITDHVKPQIGEKVADFACGTGGFLVEALTYMQKNAHGSSDLKKIEESIFGIEWKPLPYMLCTTNLLLHNINNPNIVHGDGLAKNLLDLSDNDLFDVILMNPPFGGSVDKSNLANYPNELASSESADLFVARIIYCLKQNGRCGLVLPDTLFINDDNSKVSLKKKLLNECNLHTIIRLPKTVFAPYSDINTNLLFFDKTGKTENIWYYRLDMPEGKKRFNKTKPMERFHLDEVDEWWDNRHEIKDVKENENMSDTWKSRCYSYKELEERNFNLDLCGYPMKEDVILTPQETMDNYFSTRDLLQKQLSVATESLKKYLNGENVELYNISEISKKISDLETNFPEEMKKATIQAAIQGKLSEQTTSDDDVEEYYKKIQERKKKLKEEKKLFNTKIPNIIDNDELFDIPSTWKWVRFGDIADFKLGKTPARTDSKSWGNDYNWVSIADMVSDGYVSETSEGISEYGFKNSFNGFISPKGTLIMSFKLTIGKVSILDKDSLHNEAIISIFPILDKDNITRDYLFKILPFISKYGEMKSAIKGNTLNSTSLNNLLIPLPPIQEQKRITEKLNKILPIC